MSWKKVVSIFDLFFMFYCFDLYYVYVICICIFVLLGYYILKGKLILFIVIYLYEYIFKN